MPNCSEVPTGYMTFAASRSDREPPSLHNATAIHTRLRLNDMTSTGPRFRRTTYPKPLLVTTPSDFSCYIPRLLYEIVTLDVLCTVHGVHQLHGSAVSSVDPSMSCLTDPQCHWLRTGFLNCHQVQGHHTSNLE